MTETAQDVTTPSDAVPQGIPVIILEGGYQYHPVRCSTHRGTYDDYMHRADMMGHGEDAIPWMDLVHPMDALAGLHGPDIDDMMDLRDEINQGHGCIHDVSSLSDDDLDVADVEAAVDALHETTAFIHFGLHRFPSPFPEIGVEGTYVQIVRYDDEDDATVRLIFATSRIFSRDIEDVVMSASLAMEARDLVRGVEVEWRMSDRPTLSDVVQVGSGQAYLDAWRPYLDRILRAAFAGMLVVGTERTMAIGLCCESGEDDTRSLTDAAASGDEDDLVAELVAEAESYHTVPVRFFGGVPTEVEDDKLLLASPYPPKDCAVGFDPLHHLHSVIVDCMEPTMFWDFIAHARRLTRILEENVGRVSPDTMAKALMLIANAECLEAENIHVEHDPDPHAAAVAACDALMTVDDESQVDARYLAVAVRTYTAAREETKARDALSRIETRIPDHPVTAVSRFAIDYGFEDFVAVTRSGLDLLTAHPTIASVFDGDDDAWDWNIADVSVDETLAYRSALVFMAPLREADRNLGLLRKVTEAKRIADSARRPSGPMN